MKKIMSIILIGFILVLSGCMDEDTVPEEDYVTIYHKLNYDYGSMSFTNTSKADIFYLTGYQYFDFEYTYNQLMEEELTTEEQLAYKDLFILLETMEDSLNVTIADILSDSSSDFKDAADSLGLEIGFGDIILFNSLKEVMSELKDSGYARVSKFIYLELQLDITLTSEEESSLEYLQELYTLAYERNYELLDLHELSLDDLILELSDTLNNEFTELELNKIEIAYDLMKRLINQ